MFGGLNSSWWKIKQDFFETASIMCNEKRTGAARDTSKYRRFKPILK